MNTHYQFIKIAYELKTTVNYIEMVNRSCFDQKENAKRNQTPFS